jgi:putative addiction module component (TIGR02574 family)
MPMTVDQLVSEARRLPAGQVSELLDRLAAELSDGVDAGVEEAWAEEIGRRMAEIDSGKVQGVPAEAVFARARKILGR